MEGPSPATTPVNGLQILVYLYVGVSTFSAGQKVIVLTSGLTVPVDIAPIAGGVVGGLIAVIVVVLTVIVLVVFLVWRNKGESAMMCTVCSDECSCGLMV